MKEILLSNLMKEVDIPSIGILVSSDDVDDQDSCEKGLVKIISYIRKDHPMVEISILPYLGKSIDYSAFIERVQNFSKNFKLTLAVLTEDEIRIFDFLPATHFNNVQVNLP